MAFDVGAVFVPVLPNLSGFAPAMQKGLSGATAGLNTAAIAASAGAVALGAFAAAGVKAAIDFDRSFTKIAAISNTSAGAIDGMKESVIALAGDTAKAPTELADALFFLASAGLDANEVMPALEASAKASAVGLGETADVANIVASALNAYSESGLTAASVTDTLVAAVREGRAEPEEFANALGRILPIASAIGVTFDQVAGSMAVLSNIGLDVNEAVTAMRGVMQAIAAPGTEAAEAIGKLGLSSQQLLDVISEDGIIGALRLLDQRARESTDGQAAYFAVLRKVIPNIRSLTGALGLTGQEADKVDKIFRRVQESTGATGEAFRTTAESDAFKMRKALNDLAIAGQQIGAAILPVLADLAEAFGPLLSVIGKLAPAVHLLAEAFVVLMSPLTKVIDLLDLGVQPTEEMTAVMGDAAAGFLDLGEAAGAVEAPLKKAGDAAKRFGGMSEEAFAEFQSSMEDAVNVGVGEFEKLNDAFDTTPQELQKALTLAVQIARRENRALREIFADKSLSDAQKQALAALPANMRDAWLQAGKAGRAQIVKDATALARANAAAVTGAIAAARRAAGGMTSVGVALAQGIQQGFASYAPSIYNTVDQVINNAIARARAAAQAESPSKKMFLLGLDLMRGLQEGITDNEQKVIDAAQKVIDKAIDAMTKDLDRLQAKLDDVLSNASSFRDSLRSGFDRFLDLSGGFTQQVPDPANPDQMITVPASGASITEFMAAQVAGAQKLADVLKALKAQGAGTALLSQVAQGGAEGLAFGQTLLQQGPAGVTAVNDALNAIADLAGGTAEGITNKFFGEKIDDLRADVKQLTQNLRILEKPQRLLVEFRGGDANALRQYILEVLSHSSLQRAPL